MTGRGLTVLDKIRSKAFGHYDMPTSDPRDLPVDNIIALMQSVGEDNDSYVASDNTHVTYVVSSARDESPPCKELKSFEDGALLSSYPSATNDQHPLPWSSVHSSIHG